MDTPTPDEIARHYSALLDSVEAIAAATDADTVERNKEHLRLMLKRNWWDGYDLAPIEAALA